MQPTTSEPIAPPPGLQPQLRVALAAVIVVVFAAIATLGTIASLGSYCLTTDGGDSRALAAIRDAARAAVDGNLANPTSPTAGGSCPVPRIQLEGEPMPSPATPTPTAARVAYPTHSASGPRASAVFALG